VKKKPATKRRRHQAALLGLALDNDDGHKRITTGEDFAIVGGSAETHEKMTETVVKTFEELKRRKKPLIAVEPKELAEILHKSTPR
jgi:heptaprenylglyceryl phosphate synthase